MFFLEQMDDVDGEASSIEQARLAVEKEVSAEPMVQSWEEMEQPKRTSAPPRISDAKLPSISPTSGPGLFQRL